MGLEWSRLTIRIPPELRAYENDMRRMFDAMIYKLRKNAHKGKWEHGRTNEYMNRLREEVVELGNAIEEGKNTVEIVLEAADVANMALILCAMAIDGRE
jgi:NTP pyrophosphatase (non-canonical NTP hydrolase)